MPRRNVLRAVARLLSISHAGEVAYLLVELHRLTGMTCSVNEDKKGKGDGLPGTLSSDSSHIYSGSSKFLPVC